MFSGIVEEMGVLVGSSDTGGGKRLTIAARHILEDAQIGESISVNGTCLTVIDFSSETFAVEVTNETLRCTTLGSLKKSDRVNLEKALKLSDRLGGHMVTGHVDTVGYVRDIAEDGFSRMITFGLDPRWSSFFVKKGSVTVEGVSLTVVDCSPHSQDQSDEFSFSVALIPHTMEVTTLGSLRVGQGVNVETDVIARYVVRLLGESYVANLNKGRESVV